MIQLANLINKTIKSSSKLKYLPALEEGDMTRRKPDIKKMKKILKRQLTPLKNGLKIITNT